jgi:hypothetical protein
MVVNNTEIFVPIALMDSGIIIATTFKCCKPYTTSSFNSHTSLMKAALVSLFYEWDE